MKLLLETKFYLFVLFDLYGHWFDMGSMFACGRDKKWPDGSQQVNLRGSLMFKLVKISFSPKKKKKKKKLVKIFLKYGF